MKNVFKTLATATLAFGLAACSSTATTTATSSAPTASAGAAPEKLTVIATANPHAEILEQAKPILLSDYNVELEITVTDDYYTPNEAVSNGDADANFFQHVPFFDNEKETNGYKISNVGGIHIEPFGIYSKTLTDIADVPEGASVVISNSVADNGRILAILQEAGLVTIKSGVETISATLNDIEENPKNIKFTEVNPELLVSTFENGEGDLVAINGNYAIQGGLTPSKDALLLESAGQDNPYVNIVVCQEGHEEDAKIKALVEVLQGEEIKNFITTNWSDGSVIPAE